MDYIRVHELEELLTHYTAFAGLMESLKLQLETMFDENVDEIIHSLVLRRNLDGPPRNNVIMQDRTGNLAVSLCTDIKREVREVCQELLIFESVIKKIDIALRAIRPIEKQIIELKYFHGLTWAEIADKVIASISQAKRRRKEALSRMTTVCRIPIDTYCKAMELLEL